MATLLFFTLVWFGTELLSLVDGITFFAITCFWASIAMVCSVYLLMKCQIKELVISLKKACQLHIARPYWWVVSFQVIFIFIPLLFLAIYYPPNTSDSLTYHLPRIEHWLSNHNIEHYPCSDVRQLFIQPFAEYVLMHIRLLAGNDYFLNLFNYMVMLLSLVVVTLIIRLFISSYKAQLVGVALVLSLPIGITQSTTTKSEYLAGFFLLTFIYYFFVLISEKRCLFMAPMVLASVALGLGLLTKITVVFFALPFCIWFLYRLVHVYRKYMVIPMGVAFFIISILNAPFYLRNTFLTGNPFGLALVRAVGNENISIVDVISNFIKSVFLHLGLPNQHYNNVLHLLIRTVHDRFLGLPIQAASADSSSSLYGIYFFMNEGAAGSFVVIVFSLLLLFLYISRRQIRTTIVQQSSHLPWYGCCLIGGWFLYSLVFKWQFEGMRLQFPLMLGMVPFLAVLLSGQQKNNILQKIFFVIAALFVGSFALGSDQVLIRVFFVFLGVGSIIYFFCYHYVKGDRLATYVLIPAFFISIPYVYFNPMKPLLLNIPLFTSSRLDRFFASTWDPGLVQQYARGVALLKERNIKHVAIDRVTEYPIWLLLNNFQRVDTSIISWHQLSFAGNGRNFTKQRYAPQAILTYDDTLIHRLDASAVLSYEILGDSDGLDRSIKLIMLK